MVSSELESSDELSISSALLLISGIGEPGLEDSFISGTVSIPMELWGEILELLVFGDGFGDWLWVFDNLCY